ncbi:ead/Ea22-like family protein [Shigella flexneri]|uniref:ead/Ea22-like family protein n=1 Tax=Shigella flexneri TaxID=623 RepID=UPI001F0CF71E|nr:ead/Ea22-like family protein [Shigella flexneri]UMU68056.1 ead/Ea22-like family protein [Shigella flexneri]
MSKIDYQALRELAKQATQGEWVAFISSGTGTYAVHTPGDERCEDVIKWTGFDGQKNAENNAHYIAAFNPEVVLALLDERERNQQYIKLRDQENEDIALTVGKLRVELEAEKQMAKVLFMENARLKSGIAGLIHLGIRYADVEVMKIAGDAQLSTPCTDSIINSIATGIRINGGE